MRLKAIALGILLICLSFVLQGKENPAAAPDGKPIYIINLGNLSRAEIADKINIIQRFNPKVIGFDAVFANMKDKKGDKKLRTALNAKKNIVLGCFARFDEGEAYETIVSEPFFGKIPYGFCSLIISKNNVVEGIDKFIQVRNDYNEIVEVYPLSLEMLRIYSPEAFKYFDDHTQVLYEFKYSAEDIFAKNIVEMDYEEISADADLSKLTDGIVLFGYLKNRGNANGDKVDTFSLTGSNGELVKGVRIHAYLINKILNEYETSKN